MPLAIEEVMKTRELYEKVYSKEEISNWLWIAFLGMKWTFGVAPIALRTTSAERTHPSGHCHHGLASWRWRNEAPYELSTIFWEQPIGDGLRDRLDSADTFDVQP